MLSMVQRGRKSRAQLAMSSLDREETKSEPPKPPDHLGDPERLIWEQVFNDFDLPTDTAAAVLATALEAHQRARACREAIARDGMTVTGRDGQAKPHPLLAVERDARQAWLSALKALGLDLGPPKERRVGGLGWMPPRR